MSGIWKEIRYRIEAGALRMAASVVPALPYGCVQLVGQCLGALAYVFDARGREAALANLRGVFGEEKSDEELHSIARGAFMRFATCQLESFWGRNLTKENYLEHLSIVFENPETEALAKKGGGIWVTPHYGNFEWIALVFGFRGIPFKVVAQEFKNPLLTPLFSEIRESSGHSVIPSRGAMLQLLRHLNRGGHAAFLTDLNQSPDKAASVIRCFGRMTCVTRLHVELAARCGLPVIPGISIPRPEGGYEMRVFQPIDVQGASEEEIESVAQQCWDVVEPHIRAFPEPWLWMYKHWRYYPKHADIEYPSYAKRSWRFDGLHQGLDPKLVPDDWYDYGYTPPTRISPEN